LHISGILGNTFTGTIIGIGAGVALLAVVGILIFIRWKRSRPSPQELERRRRLALHARGKMGDATLVEMRENLVFYSYDVRGVEYIASQDVSALLDLIPHDATVVNGVVFVKYDPRNPANSMILCEQWSGIRPGGVGSPASR
jgi:hypothetical protein